MNDAWAIAAVAMTAVLGWIAAELHAIRAELSKVMTRDDCTAAMDGHCDEIRNLWSETRKQGERLARLEK